MDGITVFLIVAVVIALMVYIMISVISVISLSRIMKYLETLLEGEGT